MAAQVSGLAPAPKPSITWYHLDGLRIIAVCTLRGLLLVDSTKPPNASRQILRWFHVDSLDYLGFWSFRLLPQVWARPRRSPPECVNCVRFMRFSIKLWSFRLLSQVSAWPRRTFQECMVLRVFLQFSAILKPKREPQLSYNSATAQLQLSWVVKHAFRALELHIWRSELYTTTHYNSEPLNLQKTL